MVQAGPQVKQQEKTADEGYMGSRKAFNSSVGREDEGLLKGLDRGDIAAR